MFLLTIYFKYQFDLPVQSECNALVKRMKVLHNKNQKTKEDFYESSFGDVAVEEAGNICHGRRSAELYPKIENRQNHVALTNAHFLPVYAGRSDRI